MSDKMKFLGRIFVAAIIGLSAYFALTHRNQAIVPSQEGSHETVVETDCPDFEPLISTQVGWTAYNRSSECYSFAYPAGWGVKETGKTVEVRRIEDLETTTYLPEDDMASFGVSKTTLGALTVQQRAEADAALASGERYCNNFLMNGRQLHSCYVKGINGNIFSIDYSTDGKLTDLEIVKQIESSVVVW